MLLMIENLDNFTVDFIHIFIVIRVKKLLKLNKLYFLFCDIKSVIGYITMKYHIFFKEKLRYFITKICLKNEFLSLLIETKI